MEAQRVRIVVHDNTDGYEVSPQRVRMRALKAFVRDVEELIRSDASEPDGRDLDVAVVAGSLAIETYPTADPSLLLDLLRLGSSERIDGIQPRRRAVIDRWQKAAKAVSTLWFEIATLALAHPIIINAQSDFRADDADQWVRVERYVRGEVEDLGGHSRANAHIRLPDGKSLLVATDRELLRADKVNRLYKPAMVRITADYNVETREYRNARLLEFVEHELRLDEGEFKRLTDRGAKAWASVPDANAWVESLRGNDA